MARFIATIAGQAGPASRIGSARSGIVAHPRGWDVGVEVVGAVEGDEDVFHVYVTSGSNDRYGRKFIGTAQLGDDGEPIFAHSLSRGLT